MALFQKSVLANYLNSITEKEILSGWEKFQNYKSISENIRTYKEEEFQYKFLEMLFVDCLGYKISDVGDEKRNLFTEVKNVSDSKKADGAIKKDDEVIAVIELKSTKTKDFKKIQEQAFGYKVNQPKCKYVITSNFEKLRFYINDATEFEEFDLFNLTQYDFKLLYVCLHINNIFKGIPEKLKTDSVFEEENITKKLYKDYSFFRKEVFNSLIENNSEYDKLLLFNKTQKLLDRFLFIFFAEDRNLLPANSISEIIKVWENDRSFYGQRSLYEVYKGYFKVLNNGRPASEGRESIFAYNGGLFAKDEVLDNIKIDDNILLKHTKNLSHYDFESDVSVNILGHIFEHSLSEIEEIQNEISGLETGTSKRKKDGVFYTPQYITKYIVENTLGKLCNEKKIELDINEETYGPSSKRSRERIQTLENYRNWLLGLTICDPACGSGAFLNQALSFLIEEHRYVDELSAKYNKDSLVLSDVKSSILENNLFGVDINEESVEIAKLSLWLRTAEKGRKLTSLNSNLKCGNSIIDDITVAGDKAFKWEDEFPQVFSNGGFDVVIGNPPYGAELDEQSINYIQNNYKSFEYQVNSYVVFYEKGLILIKENGILAYITPATFTYQHYFKKIRAILNQYTLLSVAKYFYEVFDDADIGDSVSWIVQKTPNELKPIELLKSKSKQHSLNLISQIIKYKDLVNPDGEYNLNESSLNIQKILKKGTPLLDIAEIVVGIKPYQTNKGKPKQTKDIVRAKIFTSTYKVNDTYINCVIGKDFHKYKFLQKPKMYLSYGKWLAEPRGVAPFFEDEKIIIRQTSDSIIATIDNEKRINLNNVYNVGRLKNNLSIKYLLGILNSKLIKLIYQNISQEKGRLFAEVKKVNLAKLPVVISKNRENYLIDLVDLMLDVNIQLTSLDNTFKNYLISHIKDNSLLPKKLQKWDSLDFREFIKELNKAIKKAGNDKLTKIDEIEWMEIFDKKKGEVQILKAEIDKTNKEIDQMVYELYGLTQKEIEIVENS